MQAAAPAGPERRLRSRAGLLVQTLHPLPPLIPPKPEPALMLSGLPPACKQIVKAP